ncbi:Vesicle-associated protein 1-2, partial [Dichanthelium oligosanthes]
MAAPAPATAGELLRIDPIELRFPCENYKSKEVFSATQHRGCLAAVYLRLTMQAQREAPSDMQCKDKFLVQSVVAPAGITVKDVTGDMFTKESGNKMEEVKLRVIYVAPPQPPSPVPEESEEGSPSRTSESENGDGPAGGFTRALRERIEPQEKSSEAGALISKLTEEKNSAIQQNHRLRQELVSEALDFIFLSYCFAASYCEC